MPRSFKASPCDRDGAEKFYDPVLWRNGGDGVTGWSSQLTFWKKRQRKLHQEVLNSVLCQGFCCQDVWLLESLFPSVRAWLRKATRMGQMGVGSRDATGKNRVNFHKVLVSWGFSVADDWTPWPAVDGSKYWKNKSLEDVHNQHVHKKNCFYELWYWNVTHHVHESSPSTIL